MQDQVRTGLARVAGVGNCRGAGARVVDRPRAAPVPGCASSCVISSIPSSPSLDGCLGTRRVKRPWHCEAERAFALVVVPGGAPRSPGQRVPSCQTPSRPGRIPSGRAVCSWPRTVAERTNTAPTSSAASLGAALRTIDQHVNAQAATARVPNAPAVKLSTAVEEHPRFALRACPALERFGG